MPLPGGDWYKRGKHIQATYLDKKIINNRHLYALSQQKKLQRRETWKKYWINKGYTKRITIFCDKCGTKMIQDLLNYKYCPTIYCNNYRSIFNFS